MKKIVRSVVNLSILLGFFIWGFVAGCGIMPTKINPHDKDLQPVILQFADEMDIEQTEVDKFYVGFRTLPTKIDKETGEKYNIIGQCDYVSNNISIDPKFWYASFQPERRKKAVVFHELAHCVCKQYKHDNSAKSDGCPVTIMNSSIPSQQCLVKHWEDYMDELYERCY